MMFQTAALLAIASLCSTAVDAFTLNTRNLSPAQLHPQTSSTNRPRSTWHIFMSEEGDEINTEEAQQETTAAGDDSGNDILNSPAFLKRKLEVLKSDIEKTEADLEAALERAEVAKEEWGPQLEDLKREVSDV
jgi:hypothetical protein